MKAYLSQPFLIFLLVFPFCIITATAQEETPIPNPAVTPATPEKTITEGITQVAKDTADAAKQSTQRSIAEINELLNKEFVGKYTPLVLIHCFTIILVTFVLRKVITKVLFVFLKKIAGRSKTLYDDKILSCLESPSSWLILVFGIYVAVSILPIKPDTQNLFIKVYYGATIVIIFWGLLRLVDVATEVLVEVTRKNGKSIAAFIPLIGKATRALVTVLGIVMLFDNIGIQISGILTTLGIGGAALAFAAKDTIANLYGSIALALDRPFKTGDWIQVGSEIDGDVEEIGLRSTKVRSWPKTVLSIPNSVLANETINNWSRMPKRRVKQVVGVTYDATAEDMENLVEDFKKILREDEGVDQDFILVNFTDFGACSLDILVYYFTKSTAWVEHMNVRQRINTKIMRAVKERDLSMAFPTQTVHLEGEVAKSLAEQHASNNLPGDMGPTTPR